MSFPKPCLVELGFGRWQNVQVGFPHQIDFNGLTDSCGNVEQQRLLSYEERVTDYQVPVLLILVET